MCFVRHSLHLPFQKSQKTRIDVCSLLAEATRRRNYKTRDEGTRCVVARSRPRSSTACRARAMQLVGVKHSAPVNELEMGQGEGEAVGRGLGAGRWAGKAPLARAGSESVLHGVCVRWC